MLNEILKIEPPEDYNVKLSHLGNLYVLDADKDGRVTLPEVLRFAEYCRDESNNFKGYEFNFQLQAQSTVRMWKDLQGSHEGDFSAWIGRLLYENAGVQFFEAVSPDIPFVNIESVKLLYDIMEMKTLKSFTLQDFFNLLQQAAEEMQMMPLERKELDNVIPLMVCQNFAKEFLFGFSKLFKEIGLHKNT